MTKGEAIKVLGLTPVFAPEEAKKAYRSKAMTVHPDKGGSVEAMANVNEAYRLLSQGVTFGEIPKIDINGIKFTSKKPKDRFENVVRWFGYQMTAKMDANKHKGFSWRSEKASQLHDRMLDEAIELKEALETKDKEKIIKECADVANFAMMIADKAKRTL